MATTVKQVEPAACLQSFKRCLPGFTVKFRNHIAEGGDGSVQFEKSPQPVVAIHHPELPQAVADERYRFAAEITASVFCAFALEILLSAPHFGQPDAHLCGLEIINPHLEKFVVAAVIRNGVVLRTLQDSSSCGSISLLGGLA